jgi:hypothetical protein
LLIFRGGPQDSIREKNGLQKQYVLYYYLSLIVSIIEIEKSGQTGCSIQEGFIFLLFPRVLFWPLKYEVNVFVFAQQTVRRNYEGAKQQKIYFESMELCH